MVGRITRYHRLADVKDAYPYQVGSVNLFVKDLQLLVGVATVALEHLRWP